MFLTLYDESYRKFCELLPRNRARVLDAACGPGNVARYLMAQRPDLELLGIDLAPRMVELAREAVPLAQFMVHDCRRLLELQRRFEGILCAFGLPYLSAEEATAFIKAASDVIDPGGILYLSTMLGDREDSGFVCYETGDRIHVSYHDELWVTTSLGESGFSLVHQTRMVSPSVASTATTDLIVIARRETE